MQVDVDLDVSCNYVQSEFMSSDFFDSILSLEKQNSNGFELFDDLEKDINTTSDESVIYDDMQCETSTFSDSGLSSDLQEMSDQILSDDELLKSILDSSPREEISAESIQPELSETIVMPAAPVKDVQSFTAPKSPIIEEKPKVINIIKSVPKPQVIKVQSLDGNSRSVLLPINIKDLKTIKIINSNHLQAENLKFTLGTMRPKKITINEKCIIKPTRKYIQQEQATEGGTTHRIKQATPVTFKKSEVSDTADNQYPLLSLTTEEKRLLNKDGIQLPCRYPLTKHEERELKRIRRKIRNKISAQDSRKRKKEYVDGLEERVKQCSEENRSLLKRIKILQLQNNKLSTQLSKLQDLVFRTGTSRAHPATCLMIVLLSVMLITLPNLRSNNGGIVDKQLNSLQQMVARRALLFSQQATNEDSAAFNLDEFIKFPTTANVSADEEDIVDVLNRSKFDAESVSSLAASKHGSYDGIIRYDDGDSVPYNLKRYIEPDIDDDWPAVKKRNLSAGHADLLNHIE